MVDEPALEEGSLREGIVDGAELDVPGEAVVDGELRVPDDADPMPREAHCDEGVVEGGELDIPGVTAVKVSSGTW